MADMQELILTENNLPFKHGDLIAKKVHHPENPKGTQTSRIFLSMCLSKFGFGLKVKGLTWISHKMKPAASWHLRI